jgi:hypothetical protein
LLITSWQENETFSLNLLLILPFYAETINNK